MTTGKMMTAIIDIVMRIIVLRSQNVGVNLQSSVIFMHVYFFIGSFYICIYFQTSNFIRYAILIPFLSITHYSLL